MVDRWIALLLACVLIGPVPAAAQGFDLQGHRGARGLAPENTLAGFARALAEGVHTLELDVGLAADDTVIVSHDPQPNPAITRDAQGQWLAAPGLPLHRQSVADLQRLDVGRLQPGTRYAQTYPEQQPADGERMPTLAQVFDLVERLGATAVRFNIEIKINPLQPDLTPPPERMVQAVLGLLRERRMLARSTIQSFDWRVLKLVQAAEPTLPTVALTARQRWLDNIADGRWTAGLQLSAHEGSVPRLVKASGARVWSPFFGDLDREQLAQARAVGLPVIVWTVNQPADIERMLDWGVDGIITDYPDRVRRALAARSMALPAPLPSARAAGR